MDDGSVSHRTLEISSAGVSSMKKKKSSLNEVLLNQGGIRKDYPKTSSLKMMKSMTPFLPKSLYQYAMILLGSNASKKNVNNVRPNKRHVGNNVGILYLSSCLLTQRWTCLSNESLMQLYVFSMNMQAPYLRFQITGGFLRHTLDLRFQRYRIRGGYNQFLL